MCEARFDAIWLWALLTKLSFISNNPYPLYCENTESNCWGRNFKHLETSKDFSTWTTNFISIFINAYVARFFWNFIAVLARSTPCYMLPHHFARRYHTLLYASRSLCAPTAPNSICMYTNVPSLAHRLFCFHIIFCISHKLLDMLSNFMPLIADHFNFCYNILSFKSTLPQILSYLILF